MISMRSCRRLLAATVVVVLSVIPVIGPWVKFVVIVLGLGAVLALLDTVDPVGERLLARGRRRPPTTYSRRGPA